jgi:hypothetical protein
MERRSATPQGWCRSTYSNAAIWQHSQRSMKSYPSLQAPPNSGATISSPGPASRWCGPSRAARDSSPLAPPEVVCTRHCPGSPRPKLLGKLAIGRRGVTAETRSDLPSMVTSASRPFTGRAAGKCGRIDSLACRPARRVYLPRFLNVVQPLTNRDLLSLGIPHDHSYSVALDLGVWNSHFPHTGLLEPGRHPAA